MDPNSAKVLASSSKRTYRKKRKADNAAKSPKDIPTDVSLAAATPTENGDGTSIWDNNFPFGDFIDKHFITEEDRKAFDEDWGIEKCFDVLKAGPFQLVSIVRFMEQKVGDLLKKNKAYDEENTELKNKLAESEKNGDNLKKDLEELILKTSRLEEREESLMEENTKMELKLHMKQNIVNKMEYETKNLKSEVENLEAVIKKNSQLMEGVKGLKEENAKMKLKLEIKENIVNKMEDETKDLKAEIEYLKAKMEELRDEILFFGIKGDEILLQQKAKFDKAIKQVLVSISELKP